MKGSIFRFALQYVVHTIGVHYGERLPNFSTSTEALSEIKIIVKRMKNRDTN